LQKTYASCINFQGLKLTERKNAQNYGLFKRWALAVLASFAPTLAFGLLFLLG
jgi:hypothetical protein